jgi:hypothetical protein
VIGFDETAKVRATLVKWKRTLRSEKERRRVERMEKESEEKMDLGDITKVVENGQMWKEVDRHLRKARNGTLGPNNDAIKFTTSVLMLLKNKSYQR